MSVVTSILDFLHPDVVPRPTVRADYLRAVAVVRAPRGNYCRLPFARCSRRSAERIDLSASFEYSLASVGFSVASRVHPAASRRNRRAISASVGSWKAAHHNGANIAAKQHMALTIAVASTL